MDASGARANAAFVIAVVAIAIATTARGADDRTYRIPRLGGVSIDGEAADWSPGAGLVVDVLSPVMGDLPSYGDFDVRLRLGWNAAGLLLLVQARDDAGVEADDVGALWSLDSVELFLAAAPGAPDWCQWVLSPGLDPRHPALRWHTHHSRRDPALQALPGGLQAVCRPVAGGYVLEALLPWASLAIEARDGREIGFQVLANDADPEDDRRRLMWYPGQRTSRDSNLMHRLRLDDEAGPAVLVRAEPQYDAKRATPLVRVAAPPEQDGAQLGLRLSAAIVGRGTLALAGSGRAEAVVPLALPANVQHAGPLRIAMELDGAVAAEILLPGGVSPIADLLGQAADLREQFGIDRPWDAMSEAPDLV